MELKANKKIRHDVKEMCDMTLEDFNWELMCKEDVVVKTLKLWAVAKVNELFRQRDNNEIKGDTAKHFYAGQIAWIINNFNLKKRDLE